jgi:hypothetical protein
VFFKGDLFKRVQNIVFWKRNQSAKSLHASSDDLKLSSIANQGSNQGALTGFYYILERLVNMLGLVFTDKAKKEFFCSFLLCNSFWSKVLEDLRNNPHLFGGSSPCFDNTDLVQLGNFEMFSFFLFHCLFGKGERVKHINVVSLARGYVLVYKGKKLFFLIFFFFLVKFS